MDRELSTHIKTIYDPTGIQAYMGDLSAARAATEQLQQGLAATGQAQFAVAGVDEATADIAVLTGEVEGAGAAIADASGQTFTANGADTAAAEFRDVADAAQEVGDEVESAEGKSRGFGETLDGIVGGGAQAAILGIAGVTAAYKVLGAVYDTVKETIRESLELYEVQAQAEAQLEQRLKATGNAAGISAEEIYAHASALQEMTRIGDETTIMAANMLLSFKNVKAEGGIFDDAITSALDLATAMTDNANPSMQQVIGQTTKLGKVLNDPVQGISALTESGVSFSESQKEMIKALVETGDLMSAQRIILDEIQSQYGGAAEAAVTFAGRQDQINNALGDAKEGIGDLLTAYAEPYQEWLLEVATDTADAAAATRDHADAIRERNDLIKRIREEGATPELPFETEQFQGIGALGASGSVGFFILESAEDQVDRYAAALAELGLITSESVYLEDEYYARLQKEEEIRRAIRERLIEQGASLALINGLIDENGHLTEKGVAKLQGMVGAYGSSSYAADEYYARQQAILEGGDAYLSFLERQREKQEQSAEATAAAAQAFEDLRDALGAITGDARGSAETDSVFGDLADATGDIRAAEDARRQITEIRQQLVIDLLRQQGDVDTSLDLRVALGDISIEEASLIRNQLAFIDTVNRLFGDESVYLVDGVTVRVADFFLEQEGGADIVAAVTAALDAATQGGLGDEARAGVDLAVRMALNGEIDRSDLDETILAFLQNMQSAEGYSVEQVMAITLLPQIDVAAAESAIQQAVDDYSQLGSGDQRLADKLFGKGGEANVLAADLEVYWQGYDDLLTKFSTLEDSIATVAPEGEVHSVTMTDNAGEVIEHLDGVAARVAEIIGPHTLRIDVQYNDPGYTPPDGAGGEQSPPDSPQSNYSGGSVAAGAPYLVGDGPGGQIGAWTELFVPESSGMIVSSSQLQTALNAVGGGQGGIRIGQLILQGGATEDDGRRFVRGVYDELSLAEARFGR